MSGALDRLHAEKDPCVKYDITRKLWVYLHRVRSVEEFGNQLLLYIFVIWTRVHSMLIPRRTFFQNSFTTP